MQNYNYLIIFGIHTMFASRFDVFFLKPPFQIVSLLDLHAVGATGEVQRSGVRGGKRFSSSFTADLTKYRAQLKA